MNQFCVSGNAKYLIQSVDNKLINRRDVCSELTLFSLIWLYKQHTVVIMKNKLWSTLHSNSPVNEEAFVRYLFGETGLSWPTMIWNPTTKNGSTGLRDGTSSSWRTHKAHHLISVHTITATV